MQQVQGGRRARQAHMHHSSEIAAWAALGVCNPSVRLRCSDGTFHMVVGDPADIEPVLHALILFKSWTYVWSHHMSCNAR